MFSMESKPKSMTAAEVRLLFPKTEFSESQHLIYVPVRMCNSLPNVNLRGRCFTPRVMANSCASAIHGLVDLEHELVCNKNSKHDNICGHICGVSYGDQNFQWKSRTELASENDLELDVIPVNPIPLYALMALYMRHTAVPGLVSNYANGNMVWGTSMECGHDWSDAHFYYRGDFIPVKDAEPGMRECMQKRSVRDYKGHPLAIAVGGKEGQVDYFGLAVTSSPADKSSDVLGMFAGSSMELASMRHQTFLPTRFFKVPVEGIMSLSGMDTEIASKKIGEEVDRVVDTMFVELAKITVLGSTDPDEIDGHVHDVLSDGMVVPKNGHGHSLSTYNITPGRKPTLTGHTDTHHEYRRSSDGESKPHVHLHHVEIDLSKKNSGGKKGMATPPADSSSTPTSYASMESFSSLLGPVGSSPEDGLPPENVMALKDILLKLDKAIGISTGNPGSGGTKDTELASVLTEVSQEIRKDLSEESFNTRLKTELANMVATGELVSKEDAEKAANAAAAKAKLEGEETAAKEKRRVARVQKLIGIGVAMDGYLPGGDDSKTIQQIVDGISLDDQGDAMFTVFFTSVQALASAEKLKAEAASTQATQAQRDAAAKALADAAEAAKKATETASTGKKKHFLSAVGGGPTELASTTAPGTTPTPSTTTASAVSNHVAAGKSAIGSF